MTSSERVVKDIRRATRKQYSAEEKIRIVLEKSGSRVAVLGYAVPYAMSNIMLTTFGAVVLAIMQ